MADEKIIQKARAAKSPEALMALAEENGKALTDEQAKEFFEKLNQTGELSDSELENAVGGCGGGSADDSVLEYRITCMNDWAHNKTGDGWSAWGCKTCGQVIHTVDGKVMERCEHAKKWFLLDCTNCINYQPENLSHLKCGWTPVPPPGMGRH